jgi:uroporphyrinogen-III decarboxylase
MDFENAALAMIDEDLQDGVHRLFDALCVFYDKLIEKFKTYYHADILLFHDDWGSQRAPFFSLNTVREMLVPYLSRIVDSCHRRGMYFELHSCGKNEMLVPAMIEAGVDIWSPQEMNDIKMLLDKYGSQLVFGVRAPLAPEMTEAETEQAAEKFFREFGSYRGVIASAFAMGSNAAAFFRKLYSLSRETYYQK